MNEWNMMMDKSGREMPMPDIEHMKWTNHLKWNKLEQSAMIITNVRTILVIVCAESPQQTKIWRWYSANMTSEKGRRDVTTTGKKSNNTVK